MRLTCRLVIFVYPYLFNKHARHLIKFETARLGWTLIRGWRYLKGDAYSKVRQMNNIKCQNHNIFFFQNKNET